MCPFLCSTSVVFGLVFYKCSYFSLSLISANAGICILGLFVTTLSLWSNGEHAVYSLVVASTFSGRSLLVLWWKE